MGMFSWFCKGGCGKPIKMGEEIIEIKAGLYSGYGSQDDGEQHGCFYHAKCFRKLHGEVDTTEGKHDPNQGCGYPDPEFLSEDSTLYSPEYDVLKGVSKVGILIDVSSSMVGLNAVRSGFDPLSEVEAAMHYLGTPEVEAITFDSQVVRQETLPADQLHHVRYDREGKWSKGGGGTDLRPAFDAALKAGCGALVVVCDLIAPCGPDDPGVPVIWFCPVSDEVVHQNYEAGKRGDDLWDGAPKPPYGHIRYLEQ